jgi:peptidoglycan hydrolase-like protein with peptidoglycan-binding domain
MTYEYMQRGNGMSGPVWDSWKYMLFGSWLSGYQPSVSLEAQQRQKALIRAAVASGMSETEATRAANAGELQRLCQYDSGVALDSLDDDYNRAIFRIQRALCSLGFDPGPITGQITVATRPTFDATIRRFQREYQLEQTGTPDRLTLRAMGFPASEVDQLADLLLRRGREPLPGAPSIGVGVILPVLAVLATGGALAFVAAKTIRR